MNPQTVKQPSDSDKIYFQNLDLVRLFAAMMVVILHGWDAYKGWMGVPSFMLLPDGNMSFLGHIMSRIIDDFGYGVDIFFLISGFLITYLLLKEKNTHERINIRSFYVRRILRIWPLYYLMVIIAPLLVNYMEADAPNYLPYIFMYGNFDVIQTGIWPYPFGHFWSVCIEEQFYLFWPLFIAFIPTKRIPVFLGLVIMFSIGYRIFLMKTQWAYLPIFLNTFSRIDVLAIGGLLAWFHFKKPISFHLPMIFKLALVGLFFYLFFEDSVYSIDNIPEVLVKKYIYLGIVILLVGSLLFGENNWYIFRKKTFLNYLGKISFGIYIYHNIIVSIILKKFLIPTDNKSSIVFWAVYLSSTILLSIISYECYEKWFLKLKKRYQVIRTAD